jgi:hypothetical protein
VGGYVAKIFSHSRFFNITSSANRFNTAPPAIPVAYPETESRLSDERNCAARNNLYLQHRRTLDKRHSHGEKFSIHYTVRLLQMRIPHSSCLA